MHLPNLSCMNRVRHKDILQWKLTSLNSEFSFSYIGCHITIKKPRLPYSLPMAGRLVSSHSTNTLGKGMNPIIIPPAMSK